MKKVLIALVILSAVIGGVIYLGLSGLDDFIREQIQTQGTKVSKTSVTVAAVESKLAEAKISISEIKIANPQGYSIADAFSLNTVRLDLGESVKEPYIVDEILIDSPAVLYEVDKQGKANLTVLQENIQAALPKSQPPAEKSSDAANPLVGVRKIAIKDVQLTLNIEALDLGDLPLEQRQYEITLPTFYTDPIGIPSGIPADQLGAAIFNSMLDNLIKESKRKVKNIIEEQGKAKAREKLNEEVKKLEEKAKDRLKGLLRN